MTVRRRRNEERNENDIKKEQNCKRGVSGRTSDFNIYRWNLICNDLVLHFETRNFVLHVQLLE